jgi:hypothetical protein
MAEHVMAVLDRFEYSDGWLLRITTDNTLWKYTMTQELQYMLQILGIEWSALRTHVTCMAHVIQLYLGVFMGNLAVKEYTKSWEAHEHDKRLGQIEGARNTKMHELRKIGNVRIH